MKTMQILDTATLFEGKVAKKTKGLRAKPIVNLLVDRTVLNKFLVDTLEAREPVSADAIMCIGESNDAWQQTGSALLKKYTVESIDPEGWMVCMPRPDQSVEFFEVTPDMVAEDGTCYVVGKWGQTIDGVERLQRAAVGDMVVRSRIESTDQWVVNRKIWRNTYTELA
jgi:hypothetical protein